MAKVHGLNEFRREWGRLPKQVKAQFETELEDIGDDLVQQMYSLAPQDTGDMAGAINWTLGAPPPNAFTVGSVSGNAIAKGTRLTVYAGADNSSGPKATNSRTGKNLRKQDGDTFYAKFVEFGTSKMAARPFFFPVWRANKKRVRARFARALRNLIKQS